MITMQETPAHSWLATMLAALVVGCVAAPPTAEDLAEELSSGESAVVAKGRICASGISHIDADGHATTPEACVPSGGDIASIACTSCANPEIWPAFPEGMKFSQGIRNPEAVKQLIADADRIVAFAKTKSVYFQDRILSGKLSSTLRRVREEQTKMLAKPAWDINAPLATFTNAVRSAAAKVIDPVAMEQAALKQEIPQVQSILDWARKRFRTPTQQYTDLAKRFQAYQAGEAGEAEQLTSLSSRASQSDLITLANVTQDLADYANRTGTAADDIALEAARLRATLAQIDEDFRHRMDAHQALIEERLGTAPDLSSSAQSSLGNMIAYCQRRRSQTNAALGALVQGIQTRKAALIAMRVDAETQQTLRDGAFLRASGEFLQQANDWRVKVGKLPPRTTKYRFYLWTEAYDLYTEVLTLEPLCSTEVDNTRPTWRDAGCIAFQRSFDIAHTSIEQSIPQVIRLAVPQLRSKGVDEATLTSIETLLGQGNIRQAVLAYDAAALTTENM